MKYQLHHHQRDFVLLKIVSGLSAAPVFISVCFLYIYSTCSVFSETLEHNEFIQRGILLRQVQQVFPRGLTQSCVDLACVEQQLNNVFLYLWLDVTREDSTEKWRLPLRSLHVHYFVRVLVVF